MPSVRADERDAMIRLAGIEPHHRVADDPAWYGYLSAAIPDPSRLVCVEGVDAFAAHIRETIPGATVTSTMPRSPSVDRVCSLVGLHHIDGTSFLKRAHRALVPGGRIALAEIAIDSLPARFLNGPIHRMSPPLGHQGVFFADGMLRAALQQAGFEVVTEDLLSCEWSFTSRQQAILYTRALFALEVTDAEIDMGITEVFGDSISWSWPLLFATGMRL